MTSKLITSLLLIAFCESSTAIAYTGFISLNNSIVHVDNNEDWSLKEQKVLFVPPTSQSYGYVELGFGTRLQRAARPIDKAARQFILP